MAWPSRPRLPEKWEKVQGPREDGKRVKVVRAQGPKAYSHAAREERSTHQPKLQGEDSLRGEPDLLRNLEQKDAKTSSTRCIASSSYCITICQLRFKIKLSRHTRAMRSILLKCFREIVIVFASSSRLLGAPGRRITLYASTIAVCGGRSRNKCHQK